MEPDSYKILKEAMRLTPRERAEIAGSLLASLDELPDQEAEAAWASEIAGRISDIENGSVEMVPWNATKGTAHP